MDDGRHGAGCCSALCLFYVFVAVVLPLGGAAADLVPALRHRDPVQAQFTLANYETAFALGPIRLALSNSLIARRSASPPSASRSWRCWSGSSTARALAGRGRDRVPRDVPAGRAAPGVRAGAAVGVAQHPDPDLRHAVAAGAGLFHRACCRSACARSPGVVLQIDKSLEECARVCGAVWGYQMRTVTLPLLRPGISPRGC